MTLEEIVKAYETFKSPNRDATQMYIAAKQALALEEIALELRCIEETLRHNPNS